MKLFTRVVAASVLAAAGVAVAQEQNPAYHIRARFQLPDNGQWGANARVGQCDVHVHSRFLQVYYGGVQRLDDFEFDIDLAFNNISGFSSHFASSPYNTNFDAYLNNAFVGRVLMGVSQTGVGFLYYASRHPSPPELPLPGNFPQPISAGDTMSFFAAAPVLPAIGSARPAGTPLFQGDLAEQFARGDVNQDGNVDELDYAVLAAHYDPFELLGPHIGPINGDFSGDNECTLEDYNILVDNWTASTPVPPVPPPVATPCYANCDRSATPPLLNVNDFICFQSRFAAGDSYANCDLSTTPPVLNVNDFICFQMKFAAGCP